MKQLPKKWIIKRAPDNYEILNKWGNSRKKATFTASSGGWFHPDMNDWENKKLPGYTQITTAQFKKYVLGEKKTPAKKATKVVKKETTSKKYTIEELKALSKEDIPWIRCTSPEQGQKIGKFANRSKGDFMLWEGFNFQGCKQFYVYIYDHAYEYGWNPTPMSVRKRVINFEDIIFPEEAIEIQEGEQFCIRGFLKINKKEVKDIFNKLGFVDKDNWDYNSDDLFYGNRDNDGTINTSCSQFGKLLTLEQLKTLKIVKKEQTKTIIGYKAPFDINLSFRKDTIYVTHDGLNIYCPKGQEGNGSELYLPSQIVETWEPVYEDITKVLHLGTPKRKFTIYKDKVEVLCGDEKTRTFSTIHLAAVNRIFKIEDAIFTYNVSVASIQIGCDDGVCLSKTDFEQIVKTQNSL